MKDLPHHIKKLNRRIIRSARREEQDTVLPDLPVWPDSKGEKRKKQKREMKAEREARTPTGKSAEERNREMKKGRVPVFDREKAAPKRTRASKKKRPPI
ncbi:MAG: hypothetical protein KGQ49_01515 [Verrucomicrobia bacterium]|nr:hypothetical protein [Verrucomicrobiota bacterium]MBU6446060.1 hypothetical protein [Verrucomicrobiota bacterium]MDE3047197.1 hypothetical protein [Verrucomicrobiota bacterium]